MVTAKPTTLCAVVSLAFSVLGCVATVALLALLDRYGEIARRSAGVGSIWMVMHLLLAGAPCMLGVLFGVVALVRSRGGQYGGRGKAWMGIALGCLPLAFALASFLLSKADSNPLRW
jgi:hypothetical protein